ncbi:virulence factor family protein [Pseudomonas kuykendallii]|uniref:Type IV secretory pathway, VirJ component n=1 Tax=Pseudomonas kuykendallii TaxID=1007099 RepID=A0A1H2ZN07_9PSED|nr:AcvB/VirJ family lysyl-phosphatidylglycerol hydrolase [Pseudomonas kuykendallii]MCQ4271964.1 virulence factor family protein [Pseudomonas kuykendallii]SDX18810.1 Type IV secretory pathway, VirJ component [Pseudomonas kuykendallii]
MALPFSRRKTLTTLLVLACLLLGVAWWFLKPPPRAQLEHPTLADGSAVTLAVPPGKIAARVVAAVPEGQGLSDAQLLNLAERGALLVQYVLQPGSCEQQRQHMNDAAAQLKQAPTLVAGIGPGGVLAWRWLAAQGSDQARALSVGFSLSTPDCPDVLPQRAEHGQWTIAWNDNPDDPSARFARALDNAHTQIADYDTPLPQLLDQQLQSLLAGQGEAMPVVDVPAKDPVDTLSLFYSGDGGWRDLDRDVAEQMAQHNYPVIGVDTLRYYWQHKTPERSASDLAALMKHYQETRGVKHFALIGYSFGANVLPAIYNRLPAATQDTVSSLILLAPERSVGFEIEVEGWLGKVNQEAPIGPELSKLPAAKVLCVYGVEEKTETGCTLSELSGQPLELPGGHHYDEDYPALATRLLDAIKARTTP